jgi:GNAT superfamily N-acetyltransferase
LLHHAGLVYEIQEMYIARNHRGTGVGKLLIKFGGLLFYKHDDIIKLLEEGIRYK